MEREAAIERLLRSYEAYYDIYRLPEEDAPLTARCEYYERTENYILSKRAEVWSANNEEFLYLIDIPHLTKEDFINLRDLVFADGEKRLHIGPGHMCSVISPIFICDSCDPEAKKALRKSKVFKSYKFSLHGWMDGRMAVVELSTGQVTTNSSGHRLSKLLKKTLAL